MADPLPAPALPGAAWTAAPDLPDSLGRWLTFLFGDDTCRCDWLWRRNHAEWERYVVARDCPHHASEYAAFGGCGETR